MIMTQYVISCSSLYDLCLIKIAFEPLIDLKHCFKKDIRCIFGNIVLQKIIDKKRVSDKIRWKTEQSVI